MPKPKGIRKRKLAEIEEPKEETPALPGEFGPGKFRQNPVNKSCWDRSGLSVDSFFLNLKTQYEIITSDLKGRNEVKSERDIISMAEFEEIVRKVPENQKYFLNKHVFVDTEDYEYNHKVLVQIDPVIFSELISSGLWNPENPDFGSSIIELKNEYEKKKENFNKLKKEYKKLQRLYLEQEKLVKNPSGELASHPIEPEPNISSQSSVCSQEESPQELAVEPNNSENEEKIENNGSTLTLDPEVKEPEKSNENPDKIKDCEDISSESEVENETTVENSGEKDDKGQEPITVTTPETVVAKESQEPITTGAAEDKQSREPTPQASQQSNEPDALAIALQSIQSPTESNLLFDNFSEHISNGFEKLFTFNIQNTELDFNVNFNTSDDNSPPQLAIENTPANDQSSSGGTAGQEPSILETSPLLNSLLDSNDKSSEKNPSKESKKRKSSDEKDTTKIVRTHSTEDEIDCYSAQAKRKKERSRPEPPPAKTPSAVRKKSKDSDKTMEEPIYPQKKGLDVIDRSNERRVKDMERYWMKAQEKARKYPNDDSMKAKLDQFKSLYTMFGKDPTWSEQMKDFYKKIFHNVSC